MKLRLMTYNIRVGIQQGLEPLAAQILTERPDVVALQEVGRNWIMGIAGDSAADLARRVGLDHFVFVPSLTQGAAHYGHALLSAYPFVTSAFRRLPQSIDEPRTLLDSVLEHPEGLVRVLSTHLSHIDDRPPQGAELVVAVSERPDLPTVVMGDLNATPPDDSFLGELLAMTQDADPAGQYTWPATAPNMRIDYILARDGKLGELAVGTDTEASDHRYVAATWTVSSST